MGVRADAARVARGLKRRLPKPVKRVARRGVTIVRAGPDAVKLRQEQRIASREIATGLDAHPIPPGPYATARLIVAPANFAGQGHQWAMAADKLVPGVTAHSFAVINGRLDFPVTYSALRRYVATEAWQRAHFNHVTSTYTHVLIEAERPLFGSLFGAEASTEIGPLREAGLKVALIAHGSDVRIPSDHAARYPWSPFTSKDWEVIPTLQYNASRNAALLNAYDGTVLVSTPDLLDDVPGARWCPVVVDLDLWANDHLPMSRDLPIVAHAPSNHRMKGSELIDPVVQGLADEGLIEYRRISDVAPHDMPGVYLSADIVLDQFRLGSYGVAACEGMAASRIVVGHIVPEVRERVRRATGRALPIVEATPDDIDSVLRRLVADRENAIATARASRAFVEAVHDGRLSADALTPFLAES